MIKKICASPRYPYGRLLVVARVNSAGKSECSIPLPEACSETELKNIFDMAAMREAEMRIELRKRGSAGNPAACYLKKFSEILDRYRDHSGHNPSVFARLYSDLGKLLVADVWEGLDGLCEQLMHKNTRRGIPYSPASINRHISMAKAAMSHAYNSRSNGFRMLPENYLAGFATLREHNISFRVLSKAERDRYWSALPDYEKPLYYYSCRIPVRVSEACNISRSNGNINQVADTITLHDGETKNGTGRILPIPQGFRAYWQAYLASGADYLFNMGHENDCRPLGSIGSNGLVCWGGRRSHDAACAAAGIEGYNRHKTRQEAVLSLYAEIRDLNRIQYIGGWASRDAFERYYDKGLIEQIEQGIYKLDTSWQTKYAGELIRKVA